MSIVHPGPFVRAKIIPTEMSVSEAAKKLGIGRQALSTFLNGNANLSVELANKLEQFFGCSAQELLRRQADFDAEAGKGEEPDEPVGLYVPPYLKILSTDIEAWGKTIPARTQLPVLLRILVHSTGRELSEVDFPGNNEGERKGWDGTITAGRATPWIPAGPSVWEFGCNQDPKSKAEADYKKRIGDVDAKDRKSLNYIAVTPHRWTGKTDWVAEKKAEKHWKSVRVLDASDLEQWIEQSIPAQVWFADITGKISKGTKSLDHCLREWQADCKPPLSPMLFAEAVTGAESELSHWATGSDPELLTIEADSIIEGVAFAERALAHLDSERGTNFHDRCVVFTTAEAVSTLLTEQSPIIAVLPTKETQVAFAPYHHKIGAISIATRNVLSSEAEITLEPLSYEAFRGALTDMGFEHSEVDRYSDESGRSLTVLRRRLSGIDAVRSPEWASNEATAQALMPMAFAGAWNSSVDIDRAVLEGLRSELKYSHLEKQFTALLKLDDTPVWAAGAFCGVISKIDALFAIHSHVTKSDLDRFFDLAEFVLSEEDPSIELPEDERWLANMKGKTREVSGALRRGIRDMLTLLAIYGNELFKKRLGIDCEHRAAMIVKQIMMPLSPQILEGHSYDLVAYAEIAPAAFLDIIEADLAKEEQSECLKLMRPASTGFGGSCPRTGLLWALESLAWIKPQLLRVVDVLGRLSRVEIDDNWVNKPLSSLQSIFRSWLPQTSADLDGRIRAIDYLAKHHPEAAWEILVSQFDRSDRVGDYSHRLSWRTDGHGAGGGTTGEEHHKFVIHCVDKALNWPELSRDKLADLVRTAYMLGGEFQSTLWGRVEEWAKSGVSDGEKSWLREKIRTNVFSLRAARRSKKNDDSPIDPDQVRRVYELLQPSDIVYRYHWLFNNDWIDPSADELEEDDFDYDARQQWIEHKRQEALEEIYATEGVKGLLRLARSVEAKRQAGWWLARYLSGKDGVLQAVLEITQANEELSGFEKDILFGMLGALESEQSKELLLALRKQVSGPLFTELLLLARFDHSTWDIVGDLPQSDQEQYWGSVSPRLFPDQGKEIDFAIGKLLNAGRPIAAFISVQYHLERVAPRLIVKMLEACRSSDEKQADLSDIRSYYIETAFECLEKSGEVKDDEIARLEFSYFSHLAHSKRGLPYLEREIEKSPELFTDLIAFVFKRSDDGEDPERLRMDNPEHTANRATYAYRLLDKLKRLPGYDPKGVLQSRLLINWVRAVQTGCEALARKDQGDSQVGQLLSRAPIGDDDVWPCAPVRDALEETGTERMFSGFRIGKYNSRGVVARGEGGNQERELERQYRSWATALEYTHPKVAKSLHEMADGYKREAEYHDTEANVRRRLPY